MSCASTWIGCSPTRAYRDALGLRGHEAYRQTWTAEVHLDRYIALIDELSNKREKRLSRDATRRTVILERLMEPRLARLAKDIVDTRRPFVVAISGSVGKTSAKDAVACVLREWTHTMASPENQNDELGVPLSIIGARPSGRNPLGWLATLQRARRILGSGGSSYPECLVLEFGSCHVGDVEHLMHLSTPDVGVLTAIEPTHLQFYDSLGAIELEEGKVVTMLPASGTGILNADNPGAAAAADRASCRIVTYGLEAGC